MGALSPLQGVGPDDLKIKGLLDRVGAGVARIGRVHSLIDAEVIAAAGGDFGDLGREGGAGGQQECHPERSEGSTAGDPSSLRSSG